MSAPYRHVVECRVPRRPGGGEPAPASVEAGIRRLVVDIGPTVSRIVHDDSDGIRALLSATKTPPDWTPEETAHAALEILRELVGRIHNPRWRAAAMAAFRMPTDEYEGVDCDSVAGRWRALARKNAIGNSEAVDDAVDRYRGYWTSAASRLADSYTQRVQEIDGADLWSRYRITSPQRPAFSLPLSFDRTEVLYQFDGDRGVRSTSHRWVTAHGDVDHYEAVGWYYSDPEAPVEIAPLANCTMDGPLVDLPQGGRMGNLKFSRMLHAGDPYYFAYTVDFNSVRRCRPTILYEVRGLSMRQLVLRIQYDQRTLPKMCWQFEIGVQAEGVRIPEPTDPDVLDIAHNGYVEANFENCRPGRQYGVRWIWPEK